MYCPKCESDVETTVKEVLETYPVKGENITIKARVRFCSICGEDIWDETLDAENLLNAYAEYRRNHGLLQPSEIRAIREKYKLSQVAFARVLGLGDKSVTRYENGSIADTAQNNLIALSRHPSVFKELLDLNKAKISTDDYNTAVSALEALRCRVVWGGKEIYSYSDTISMEFNTTRAQYWGDLYA